VTPAVRRPRPGNRRALVASGAPGDLTRRGLLPALHELRATAPTRVAASWRIVQPMLDPRATLPPRDFPNHAAGAWGPDAADQLLRRDGRCRVNLE
jgi:glucose-6-phosphate 1-dehydrogenase